MTHRELLEWVYFNLGSEAYEALLGYTYEDLVCFLYDNFGVGFYGDYYE